MKKFSALLLVFALLFTAMPIGSISAAGTQEDPLRILAIGNSYSNNATEYISSIADSMGIKVTAASLYYPGCSLERHVTHYEKYSDLGSEAYYADDNTYKYESFVIDGVYTDTSRSIQEAIAYADWDYITIQQMPDGCDDITTYWTEAEPWLTTLYDYVKTELEKNNNTDCEILIHQGWSFSHAMSIDNAYEYYPVDYNNTREFFAKIESTVNEAANIIKEHDTTLTAAPSIVPSGKAVQLAKDEFGFADTFGDSNSIYDDYISHLSPIGRYLVACVWIETFAAKAGLTVDTREATYIPENVGITEDMAAALRSCAHEAVTGKQDTVYSDDTYSWRAVPQDDGLKITHFMGIAPENGAITIPSALNNTAVVAVDDTIFKYVEGVRSVTFEEGADVSVEDGAFDGIADIWYGQIATSYAGGQGTETDPYLIENGAQLTLALNSFGKMNDSGDPAHYKLTADIYLNDVSSDTWTSNNNNTWFQGKDKSTYYALNDETTYGAFEGSIDGDGHMVYGIFYPETTTSFASGLIPVFSGSYIKNIGVDKAYIVSDLSSTDGNKGAGAIAGITTGKEMSIDSCFSGADITVKSSNSGASGIVGTVKNGETTKLYVSNCYSLAPNENIVMGDKKADKDGSTYANGILGNTWQVYFSVTNSYSVAKPYCLKNANTMSQDCLNADKTKASEAIITNFANVYSGSNIKVNYYNTQFADFGTYTDGEGTEHYVATQLTADQMTGANALENMLLGDKFFATDSYPALRVFYPQLESGTVWDGSSLIAPTEGSGTETDPIEISTAAQLAYVLNAFGKDADDYGLHYKLTADIYLNDVSEDTWTSNSNINTWFVGKEPTKYYTLDKSANGAFVGSIDGDGHMVYGIYYPDDTDSLASGLIPVFSGSYIKNIGVDKAYLVTSFSIENGYKGAGAIAGVTTGNTMKIDSCFSGADIKIKTNATAASGIVGSVRNTTAATKLYVSNCYSLIPADNFAFKNSEEYYPANHDKATKANGIIGDNYVVYFSVTNSYSVVRPYRLSSKNYTSQDCLNEATDAASSAIIENFANVYSQNIYTSAFTTYTDENTVTHQVAYKLTAEEMQGANAFEKMTGFEDSIWYAVKNDTKSPMLRVHGTTIGDVDEDGVGLATGDAEALRKHLIGTAQALNGNYNKDDAKDIDILDLVALTIARAEIDGSKCKHSYKSEVVVKSTATTKGTANLTCTVCGHTKTDELPTEVKILAIGNSYSIDAMEYLWNILTDAGVEKVTLGNIYKGGCDLNTHWEYISNDTAGYGYLYNNSGRWSNTDNVTLDYGLADEDWDFITVQQSSLNSGISTKYDNLLNILNYLNKNKTNEDAKILWHMTWAYSKEYVADYESYNGDQITMYNAITSAVKEKVLTETLISGVIPSGTTVQNMRTSYLGDTIDRDGSHMNMDYGRYAVGLTWMTAITGITPDKVDWVPTSDTTQVPEYKALIDEAVTNAISNPYVVTNSTYTTAPSN